MTEPSAPMTPEERDALASELALGLLTGAERAEALRLQLSDPAFAADVTAWERRLAPLHHDFAEHRPSLEVWAGIAAQIEPKATVASGVTRQLRVWRASALVSGALAASLAVVLLFRPPASLPPQIVQAAPANQMAVAQMVGQGSNMLVAARYDETTAQLNLRAENLPQGDLAPELWVIPADGKPRSLGMISARGTTRMAVSPKMRAMLENGVTLAITMEPAATAPHAAPSSAPVAAGKISII